MCESALRLIAIAAFVSLGSFVAHAHPHNSIEVISPPTPIFPDDTVAPGRCEVRFEVSDYTKIKVTSAECSDYIYCKPARIAVEGVDLRVIDNDGEEGIGIVKNALYPIDFIFDPPSEAQIKWIKAQPMFPCDQSMMF